MKESKHQNNDKSVKPTRATFLKQPPGHPSYTDLHTSEPG